MTQTTAIIILIVFSGICQLAGAILSLLSMPYQYEKKNRYVRNAEWGIVAILFAATCTTIKQLLDAIPNPSIIDHVSVITLCWRILFLWVPLNYFLNVRKMKRYESREHTV